MSDAQIKPNTETLGLGDRERFYPFGQSERTGEQDLSNLSSPKSKSREFLCGYGVGEGRREIGVTDSLTPTVDPTDVAVDYSGCSPHSAA